MSAADLLDTREQGGVRKRLTEDIREAREEMQRVIERMQSECNNRKIAR